MQTIRSGKITVGTRTIIAQTCLRCHRFLQADDFFFAGASAPQRNPTCRDCVNASNRRRKPKKQPHRLSGGILVAKTCPDCGDLKMAAEYAADSRSSWRRRICGPCDVRWKVQRFAEDEALRLRARRTQRGWSKAQNDETRDRAGRHGAQWTGAEYELLSRTDLTAPQIAQMLGRTVWAVRHKRRSDAQLRVKSLL